MEEQTSAPPMPFRPGGEQGGGSAAGEIIREVGGPPSSSVWEPHTGRAASVQAVCRSGGAAWRVHCACSQISPSSKWSRAPACFTMRAPHFSVTVSKSMFLKRAQVNQDMSEPRTGSGPCPSLAASLTADTHR